MTVYARLGQIRVPRLHRRPDSAGYIGKVTNEQWLEDRIGVADLEAAIRASREMHVPLPIAGTGAYLYRGDIHIVDGSGLGQASPREAPTSSLWGAARNVIGGTLRPQLRAHAGFASLSDLISEATTGAKGQYLGFNKVGIAGVVGRSSTLWYAAGIPGVGGTAAALAGGTNYTSASAGAIIQKDAAGGDTLHIVGAEGNISVLSMGLLLYDRIWGGEPTITSAVAQTVTETLARYATTGASGTSKGNVVFCEVRATLGAATPNLTLQYVDDSGNGAENAAVVVGITAAATPTFPYGSATLPNLFIPLNAGDAGASNITQWTQSASYLSGSYAIVAAHPLMYIPGLAIANAGYIRDGINSAFNLQRVYDSACLALLEPQKPATTATTFTGFLTLVSG